MSQPEAPCTPGDKMHFPTLIAPFATAIILLSLTAAPGPAQAQPAGRDLAQGVYDRYVGDDMTCHQVMELVPADGQARVRELTITAADRDGLRRSLLRFTSPADIEGTGFLALEDGQGGTEQFLYLPALKRSRRIVAGQKGRSFVNTDFTFEDMERRPVDDSDHTVAGEEAMGGVECWILESKPKPEAESQYSTVRAWVAKDMLVVLRADFFKKGPEPVKRYTVLQMENVQEIWTETKVTMEDLETGHKTVLTTSGVKYNTGVEESAFSVKALETW